MSESVRLKLARREFFSGGGFSGTYAPISVKVKNIGYAKDVAIHYTPYGDTWKDFPLVFSSHYGDHDLFQGEINEQVSTFVVRYSADGVTYFDNNLGQNYDFDPKFAVVGGNVALNKATAKRGNEAGGGFVFTTSWLEGEILVNNLSYAKRVGIRFSADGGTTWEDVLASFAGTSADGVFVGPDAEVWRFKSPEYNLNPAASEFRLAVFYQNLSTGAWFWDNNFGQDYKVSKADGATVG